ncbi:MAG TPA: hypothetical protein VGS78_13000 [Candidatus Sulfotelmatobacter sp.]|nr:hypothetical protein [Candidatus Sulfotelmatobacter sp.]
MTAAFVLFFAAGGAWFLKTRRTLVVEFGPIAKNAPTLTQADIEALLAGPFELTRRVRQIPPTLRESFTNVTALPFDMNNPGDPMSTDVIINAPSRQLTFAAVNQQSAIVVYEQGSFASFPCAVIFLKGGKAAWLAIDDYFPTDIESLRRSVHEARFKLMTPGS